MDAKVVYSVEWVSFGDNHDDTGWYLMRLTIMAARIIDRKPIARFNSGYSSDIVPAYDTAAVVEDFSEYCKKYRVADKDLKGIDNLMKL